MATITKWWQCSLPLAKVAPALFVYVIMSVEHVTDGFLNDSMHLSTALESAGPLRPGPHWLWRSLWEEQRASRGEMRGEIDRVDGSPRGGHSQVRVHRPVHPQHLTQSLRNNCITCKMALHIVSYTICVKHNTTSPGNAQIHVRTDSYYLISYVNEVILSLCDYLSLQTHGSVAQIVFLWLFFITSLLPERTCPDQWSFFFFFFITGLFSVWMKAARCLVLNHSDWIPEAGHQSQWKIQNLAGLKKPTLTFGRTLDVLNWNALYARPSTIQCHVTSNFFYDKHTDISYFKDSDKEC